VIARRGNPHFLPFVTLGLLLVVSSSARRGAPL